jgi:signal transduction histidine kinase
MSIRRTAFRRDPKLVLLSIGLGFQVFADFWFLLDGVGESFVTTSPRLDLFLVASASYVGVGVLMSARGGIREYPERATSSAIFAGPYLLGFLLIALALWGVVQVGVGVEELVTLFAAVLVFVLVVLRQVVAIRDLRTRVERQRGELISSVSHEIRTPLTGMMGYLDVLANSPELLSEEERTEMIGIAATEAAHLGRVITDMITMARGDGAQLVLTSAPALVSTICEQAVARSGIDVAVDVDRDATAVVDSNRLIHAVMNLLSNAGRFGGGRVALVVTTGQNDFTIEVHDDGPGVPIRHQDRIWDSFERGSHRYDVSAPGVGVGLTVVRAIAVAHGGSTVYRTSELFGGACFAVSVPFGDQTSVRGPMRNASGTIGSDAVRVLDRGSARAS